MLLIIYPILHRPVSPLMLLTHLLYFFSFHTLMTQEKKKTVLWCELLMEYVCKLLLWVNLPSQHSACKNIKTHTFCKTTANTPNSRFLLGFSLNKNIHHLWGCSLVRSADKQNVQFQPWPSQEEALCDERAFNFESIRACSFSTGWYHPHNYTCSLVEWYLYPFLGFDPTTSEADQAVMIVINTC